MKDIITLDQFKALARPTSIHLDEAHFKAYVQEAESKYIIPAIGWELYGILTEGAWNEGDPLDTILKGGEYEVPEQCQCESISPYAYCHGLQKATAYFTYAIMDKADGAVMSRAGMMRHRDEYADHIDDKVKQFDSVMDMAELYLSTVLEYINTLARWRKAPQTRATIKAIGD